MATHGKIEEFDPSHETWATYVERPEFYFIANGIDDPVKKRAVLLTVSGPATYKLIRNLSAPKKPTEKSYDELVALVKSHYTPKPSVIVQRFQFHSRTQKPGETVATFVAELRQLSEFCEFDASLEDMPTRPASMWNRKRQHPATIAGGARSNATEGSEPYRELLRQNDHSHSIVRIAPFSCPYGIPLASFPGSSAQEREIELVHAERAWYLFSRENPQR